MTNLHHPNILLFMGACITPDTLMLGSFRESERASERAHENECGRAILIAIQRLTLGSHRVHAVG